MFAMLAGRLPPPPAVDGADDALRAVVELQVGAGIDPVSDGGALATGDAVARWLALAACDTAVSLEARAPAAVAPTHPGWVALGVVPGPWTTAVAMGSGVSPGERELLAAAETAGDVVRALATAGCAIVRVDEPALAAFPADDRLRERLARAHRRLLAGGGPLHVMLSIVGGDATAVGAGTLFDLPYHSYLFDLVRGPESWRLVVAAPRDRGIVCGVVPTGRDPGLEKELMVWAARYAASTAARGLARVGLATAGDLDGLPWDVAAARVRRLGEAARIAALTSYEDLAAELDPRALDARSAALGRPMPPPARRTGPEGGR